MGPQNGRYQRPVEHRHWATGAQSLKRVFGIDTAACPASGEALWITDCIGDPAVTNKTPSSGPRP